MKAFEQPMVELGGWTDLDLINQRAEGRGDRGRAPNDTPSPSGTGTNSTMEELQNRTSLVSQCVGCGLQIVDRFLLKVFPDLRWHAGCLKCAECQRNLDESHTCFIKDGKTLCKEDYSRLYAIKCVKCLEPCSSRDYVMRAGPHVYHLQCFRCARCDHQLLPGDRFTLHNGHLLCTHHLNSQRRMTTPADHVTRLDTCARRAVVTRPERSCRVRTVLSEAQLHVLRSCYSSNPRPDALVKEQLVELTGLSSRVIRVWFQNKRCKDKKQNVLQRLTQHEPRSQVKLRDNPLLELLDSDTLMKTLELQNFQPSLKLLTSFS